MPLEPGKSYSQAMVLKEYFGLLPDQNVMGFAVELKCLSAEEKTELATGAAKELGVLLKV